MTRASVLAESTPGTHEANGSFVEALLRGPRLATVLRATAIVAFFMVTPRSALEGRVGATLIAVLATGAALQVAAAVGIRTRAIGAFMMWFDLVALGLLLHMGGGERSALLPVTMVWAVIGVVVHTRQVMLAYEAAIAIMLAIVTVSPDPPPQTGSLTLLGTTLVVGGAAAWVAWWASRRLMRLQSDLEMLALQDSLTELWNRRAFDERFRLVADSARRTGEPFSVAMIDLDHFKSINDRFGHSAGDAVLRGVAEILRSGVRPSDEVFRLGGEEFTILFPRTRVAEAARVVERIRCALEAHRHNPAIVTLTAGVVDGRDESTLQRADVLLLEGKADGRNRVLKAPASYSSDRA